MNDSRQKPAGADQPQAPGQDARRLRVLVVEDQAVIAMEIEDILDELGAEVIGTASSPEEALDLAELHCPDLVTMDINLGAERDGVSVALEIHERLGIHSIFISAYDGREDMDRARHAHALAWISKPVDAAKLREALGRAPAWRDD